MTVATPFGREAIEEILPHREPFLLSVCGGGRHAAGAEAIPKEGSSCGKHGFPHASEPKASEGHATSESLSRKRLRPRWA
jgi:hypothetical protein